MKNLFKQIRFLFVGRFKKVISLKNGFDVAVLKNGYAIICKRRKRCFHCACFESVLEAVDGKFMLKKEDGQKIILNKYGQLLTDWSCNTQLYKNGWYLCEDEDIPVSSNVLYDDKDEVIAVDVCSVAIAKNGYYAIEVLSDDFLSYAGIYNPAREKIIDFNTSRVTFFWNGYFIVQNTLYDFLGEAILSGSRFRLKCVGLLFPPLRRFFKKKKIKP